MLTVDQMIELEILTRDEIKRLESETSDSRKDAEAVSPDKSIGRLSRLDAMQMQAMAVAAQQRRRIEQDMIDAALQRIEMGDYGFCVRCGEPIAPARLQHVPAVPTCLECAKGK